MRYISAEVEHLCLEWRMICSPSLVQGARCSAHPSIPASSRLFGFSLHHSINIGTWNLWEGGRQKRHREGTLLNTPWGPGDLNSQW